MKWDAQYARDMKWLVGQYEIVVRNKILDKENIMPKYDKAGREKRMHAN